MPDRDYTDQLLKAAKLSTEAAELARSAVETAPAVDHEALAEAAAELECLSSKLQYLSDAMGRPRQEVPDAPGLISVSGGIGVGNTLIGGGGKAREED